MRDVSVVLPTATLQMPRVATHPRPAFVDTNVTGTLRLIRRVGSEWCVERIFDRSTWLQWTTYNNQRDVGAWEFSADRRSAGLGVFRSLDDCGGVSVRRITCDPESEDLY